MVPRRAGGGERHELAASGADVPLLASFDGIAIAMYFGDHPPPHFHVGYAECSAVISIERLALIHGVLPRRVLRIVRQWGLRHRPELIRNWELASSLEPLHPIPPWP